MIIIGHRGARGLAPENTIAALQKALEYGVDMMEIDARTTKDGIAVVHHDPVISDPDGNKLSIREHTLTELRIHKPDLVSLEAAISYVRHKVPVVIEIKPKEPTAQVIACIHHAHMQGWRPSDLWVASFSAKILAEVRAALPDTPLIVNERWSGLRATWRARRLGTLYIAMNARWLWRPFIRAVSRHGYHLFTYTLNDPKKGRLWQAAGLAGIYTDYPDRFQRY